jgi:hypothetical protein
MADPTTGAFYLPPWPLGGIALHETDWNDLGVELFIAVVKRAENPQQQFCPPRFNA